MQIQNLIVKSTASAKYCSVLADGKSDNGHAEQLNLFLSFVKSNEIHKNFNI